MVGVDCFLALESLHHLVSLPRIAATLRRQIISSEDLKTSACRDGASVPSHVQPLLDNVHPEVVSKYYGCGLVAPAELRGRRVLDLGAG